MHRFNSLLLASAIIGASFAGSAMADTPITSFTPGTLVVLRGAGASTATTNSSLFLDEYSTAGTYIGTIAITDTGADALTLPGWGDAQHQGALNLSGDGHLLTFAGYNANSGSADGFITPAQGKRIGFIGSTAASLNTTTPVAAYNGSSSYFRSVYTANGSTFYTFGKYDGAAVVPGGIQYVTGTGPSATTSAIETYADIRNGMVVNGQLYGATGSSSITTSGTTARKGVYKLGSGAPTSQLNTTSQPDGVDNTQVTWFNGALTGSYSLDDFKFASITGGSAGLTDPTSGANVLYGLGDTGVVKYLWSNVSNAWVGGTANAVGDMNTAVGLTVAIDPLNPGAVDIYVTGRNGLYSYVDTAGNTSTALGSFTKIASPNGSDGFYGVAFAPTAVPEPASLSVLALGGAALIARRRRRA